MKYEFVMDVIFSILAALCVIGTIVIAIEFKIKINREDGKINLVYTDYTRNFEECFKSINCKILKRKH